jgi:hypothetical protein
MRHLLYAFAGLAVFGTACASSGVVGSHVERGAGFAAYRTYDWGVADALPLTNPRFAANSVLIDHLHGAIERGLRARGLQRATAGTPDLLVHYHATAVERLLVQSDDARGPSCREPECQPTLIRVDEGTLVFDVVDARTGRTVWRGWLQNDAREMLRHPERIDEAVLRMLDALPLCGAAAPTGGR